jgi:hypothetical protein
LCEPVEQHHSCAQPAASPHDLSESSREPDGTGTQAFAAGSDCCNQAVIKCVHETASDAQHALSSVALHFTGAQESALSPEAKVFVSLGTLAALATGAIDDSLVHLKRQVVVWGGHHIVACELAAESALFQPAFSETLPWHYFHAQRSKSVGDGVEWQHGLLNGVQYFGLRCH